MGKLLRRNRAAVFTTLLSAIFLLYGIAQGEVTTVFRKAIRICLECIGIG